MVDALVLITGEIVTYSHHMLQV